MPDTDNDTPFPPRKSCIQTMSLDRDLVMPDSDAERDAETDASVTDGNSEQAEDGIDVSPTSTDYPKRQITLRTVESRAEGESIFSQPSHDWYSAEGFAEELVMPDSDEAASPAWPASAVLGGDFLTPESDSLFNAASAHSASLIMPDSDDDNLRPVPGRRTGLTVHFAESSDLVMPDWDSDHDSDHLARNDLNESDRNNMPDSKFRDIDNMSGSKSLVLVNDCNLL